MEIVRLLCLHCSHGNDKVFSCRGIKLVIDFFQQRGHAKVIALVPQWRRRVPTFDRPVSDHHILEILKDQGTLTFTPSRRIGNCSFSCYDDRSAISIPLNTMAVWWCLAYLFVMMLGFSCYYYLVKYPFSILHRTISFKVEQQHLTR